MTTTSPYGDASFERCGGGGDEDDADSSGRSEFAIDRDRVLYSSAFRTLAGKTQVVAASELGNFHNRLTHTLKVAQLGRVITQRLAVNGAPDVDLVETACLLHDIGHPPFGHAGEQALKDTMDELGADDGFEGNAQNLRIISRLASGSDPTPGLHLTRASMLAATKYPWMRHECPDAEYSEKWGAYTTEKATLGWMVDGLAPGTPLLPGPVEKQIMDWCDDVAYACHDMEDFYRKGYIPLSELLRFEMPDAAERALEDEPAELERFLDYVEKKRLAKGMGWDRREAVGAMRRLQQYILVEKPFESTHYMKRLLRRSVSKLITHFADVVTLDNPGGRGYDARIVVPDELRFECELLKELIWFYVIERPQLAGQQHGQKRIVADLLTWHYRHPELFPPDRKEELAEHGDPLRAACDHVASLTETHALRLHRRLAGTDPGAFTDAV